MNFRLVEILLLHFFYLHSQIKHHFSPGSQIFFSREGKRIENDRKGFGIVTHILMGMFMPNIVKICVNFAVGNSCPNLPAMPFQLTFHGRNVETLGVALFEALPHLGFETYIITFRIKVIEERLLFPVNIKVT